jgi:hypothetical protein
MNALRRSRSTLIIVEVDSMEEATAMATEWPSLNQGPGAGVQVEAVAEH